MKLVINDLVPFTGEYNLEFDDAPFTNRELHWIKQVSGVRLGELDEAINAGDNDVLIAIAAIIMVREGKAQKNQFQQLTDRLMDAPGGQITFVAEESDSVEGDAGPPEIPTPATTGSDENNESSLQGSNGIGDDRPVILPLSTGNPG